MTYAAVSTLQNLNLGKLAKILSKGSVYPQLPNKSAMWKKMLAITEGVAKGRYQNFEVLTGHGGGAVQFLTTGSRGTFPVGQASEVTEGTVHWKDFGYTVQYDLTLQNKTGGDLYSYGQPFALEMQAKGIANARMLSAAVPGDGSGVIGIVGSVTASASADELTVVLSVTHANADRSHPGWFDRGDLVKFATTAGVAHTTINNTGTSVTAWRVKDSDHDSYTIVLEPLDSSYAVINISTATLGATDPTAGDAIYRRGTTINDIANIAASDDYNTASEVFAGLASLTANDGRKVNGLTMSGVLEGSRRNCGGELITPKDFRKVLSLAKRRTSGESDGAQLSWSEAFMHDIVYDALAEQAEATRLWYNTTDPVSGVKKIGHQHKKQVTEFSDDEFVPFQRVYILPDQKGPLCFYGTDVEKVKVGSVENFLMPSATAGTYDRAGMMFFQGSGALVARHPAALPVLENFTFTS